MSVFTRSALVLLGLASVVPQSALAATALGNNAEIVFVDGEVDAGYTSSKSYSHGMLCEIEVDGETHDCSYVSLETGDQSYTDYLLIEDICDSGRYCSDGTLMAMKVVHTVNWDGDQAEMESDIWVTRGNRIHNVGAVYSDITVEGSEVTMDIALLTDSWTTLDSLTFDRCTEPSGPDAVSTTSILMGALGGAKLGKAGGLGGAIAGAVVGAGAALATEIFDEANDGDDDGGEGGEEGGDEGDAEGGDVQTDTEGTCDTTNES